MKCALNQNIVNLPQEIVSSFVVQYHSIVILQLLKCYKIVNNLAIWIGTKSNTHILLELSETGTSTNSICDLIYLSCSQVYHRQFNSVSAIDLILVLKSRLELLQQFSSLWLKKILCLYWLEGNSDNSAAHLDKS